MQIHGPSYLHGVHSVHAPQRAQAAAAVPTATPLADVDQLDLSHEATMISRMSDVSDIRADRVAAIRAQIEAGLYETGDKLAIAVDRLLDEIG